MNRALRVLLAPIAIALMVQDAWVYWRGGDSWVGRKLAERR